jgi:hypothetical protein
MNVCEENVVMCWFDTVICVTNLGEMTHHYENTTILRRDGLHHLIFIKSMTRVFTCSLSDNVGFFKTHAPYYDKITFYIKFKYYNIQFSP